MTASYKQAVLRLVESHREITTPFFHRPFCDHGLFAAVDDRNLLSVRQVNENTRTFCLKLEGLGMSGERNAIRKLVIERVNHAERAVCVTNVDEFCLRIETNIV